MRVRRTVTRQPRRHNRPSYKMYRTIQNGSNVICSNKHLANAAGASSRGAYAFIAEYHPYKNGPTTNPPYEEYRNSRRTHSGCGVHFCAVRSATRNINAALSARARNGRTCSMRRYQCSARRHTCTGRYRYSANSGRNIAANTSSSATRKIRRCRRRCRHFNVGPDVVDGNGNKVAEPPSRERFGVIVVLGFVVVAVGMVMEADFVAVLVVVVLPPCGCTDTVMSARA